METDSIAPKTADNKEQKPMEETATHLLTRIGKREVSPKLLNQGQRWLCIRFLLNEQKHTSNEIAEIMQVHVTTVWRHRRQMLREHVHLLNDLDERNMAIKLIVTAETASSRLFRKGKEWQAFDVIRNLVKSLQELGYLHRAPIEIEGKMTIQEFLRGAASTIIEAESNYKNNGGITDGQVTTPTTGDGQITAPGGQDKAGEISEAPQSMG